MTADRPEVRSFRSSRTRNNSPQESTPAVDRRPTCLTHFVISDYSEDRTIAFRALKTEYLRIQRVVSTGGNYEFQRGQDVFLHPERMLWVKNRTSNQLISL